MEKWHRITRVILVIAISLSCIGWTVQDCNFTVRGTLINAGVPAGDVEKCLQWAFGDNYWMIPLHETDTAWNAIHSDIFILKGDDGLIESFERIGRAYLNRG